MRLRPVFFTLLVSLLLHTGVFFFCVFFLPVHRMDLKKQASSLPMLTFKMIKPAPVAAVVLPLSKQTESPIQSSNSKPMTAKKATSKNTLNMHSLVVMTANSAAPAAVSAPVNQNPQPASLPIGKKPLQYLSGTSLLAFMHANTQNSGTETTGSAAQTQGLSNYRHLIAAHQEKGLDAYIKQLPGPYQNLKRQEDGSYEYKHTHFVAHIRENGEVVFKDPISIGYVLGITEHLMRKVGNDPYLSQKNEFLDAVKTFRQELRLRYEQAQQMQALSVLGQKLDRIARAQWSLETQKQHMLNLLQGCDPNTEAGQQAIALIQSRIALLNK